MMTHGKRQTVAANGRRGLNSTTRKGGRSRLIVLLVVVAVTASVLFGWWRSPAPSDVGRAGSTFAARKGDLVVTVIESGSIRARQTIDIRSEVYGEATIISLVPEGTYITQEDVDSGKVIVEL